jgi:adenosylcobinamide kinase/adenosylcobinamide-phosphate guanylyltransferase
MKLNAPTSRQIILVTGAARSGKSEWAEKLAKKMEKPVTYIATATRNPEDAEWEARIARHCLRRPKFWQTLEIPVNLTAAIGQAQPPQCLLIDSLGTWVANCLTESELSWQQMVTELLDRLQFSPVDIILVAEETGWGVVPSYPLGRIFRDRLGELIRKIGAAADRAYLVAGGYALNLAQLGQSLE